MEKSKKSVGKSILSIVIILIFISVISVAIYALVTKYTLAEQDYLSFSVVAEDGKVLRSSEDNKLVVGKTYTYSAKYLYPEDIKEDKQEKSYKARVYSSFMYDFDYYMSDSDKPYAFNGIDYSEAFNLKIEGDKFSITIPDLSALFFGAKDKTGKDIYLGDIFSYDSFMLVVESFNSKTIIEYCFHFDVEGDVELEKIELDDDLIFVSDKSTEIDVEFEGIEIDGDIKFDENTEDNITIDKIEVEGDIGFVDNAGSTSKLDKIEVEGDIEFVEAAVTKTSE